MFLKIFLYFLAAISGLVVLLLLLPMAYRLRANVDERPRADVAVSILLHFASVHISYHQRKARLHVNVAGLGIGGRDIALFGVTGEAQRKSTHKNERTGRIKEFLRLEFLHDAGSLFKDVLWMMKPHRVKIHGVYGFEDPSLTGMLCGLVPMLSLLVHASDIQLRPEFDDPFMDVSIAVSGRVIPAMLVMRMLRFVLKKNIRQKLFRRSKDGSKGMKLMVSRRV